MFYFRMCKKENKLKYYHIYGHNGTYIKEESYIKNPDNFIEEQKNDKWKTKDFHHCTLYTWKRILFPMKYIDKMKIEYKLTQERIKELTDTYKEIIKLESIATSKIIFE